MVMGADIQRLDRRCDDIDEVLEGVFSLIKALDQRCEDLRHGPPGGFVGEAQAYYARQDAYATGGLEGLAAHLRELEG